MPKRPRQHVLEDLSRTAFESLASPHWVCQRRSPEYGVDVDVEIFRDQSATGARFAVQLKAVENTGRSPRATVATSTLRYWRAHDGLVLLVLWEATTSSAWYIWTHHIDSHGIAPGQRTFTVRIPMENRLEPAAHAAIEAEVFARRSWTKSYDLLPLSVRCLGTGTIHGVSAGNVVNLSRSLFSEFGDVFRFGGPKGDIFIDVHVGGEEIRVDVSGGPPVVFHVPNAAPRRDVSWDVIRGLAANVVFGAALQLFRMNLGEHAGRVTEAIWRDAPIATSSAMGMAVTTLVSSGRVAQALELVRSVSGDQGSGIEVALGALTLESIPPQRAEEAARILGEWAQEMARSGNVEDAAIQFYNASTRIRASAPNLCLDLLDEAARLDESYRRRAYWWGDRAAALFHAGRYSESAEGYATAIDMGDSSARVLLGDALIFAGQYGRGIQVLLDALDPVSTSHAEWRLKVRCFPRLLELTGLAAQERDSARASSALEAGPTRDACLAALRADALFAPASFWLALSDEDGAIPDIELAVCAALSEPSDPYPWLVAMSVAGLDERAFHTDIALTARRFAGDAVVDALYEEGRLLEASELERYLDELPPEDPKLPVLRHTQPGSAVYEETIGTLQSMSDE